ncbi:hypothetical protein MNBD_ALPHA11-353, partial [hydrothermal vent metagenome]
MRHLVALAIYIVFAVITIAPANAFEVIAVPSDVNAINLSAAIDVVEGTDGRVRLSTAPGADGIVRRIEVLAAKEGTNPAWALFALSN